MDDPHSSHGPIYGYKTYLGAVALILLAIGNVLQGASDGTDVDLNRAVNDVLVGMTIFGAAYRAGRAGK